MAVVIHVTPVPPFDPHEEPSTIAERWNKWVRSFALFADASGCTDDGQKRKLLLHCAGSEVQDIFDTLEDVGDTYQATKNKLDENFAPQQNTSYNHHKFHQEHQQEGETVGQYVTRLPRMAQDCGFRRNEVPKFICDQVIDCCRSQKLRTKLLAER